MKSIADIEAEEAKVLKELNEKAKETAKAHIEKENEAKHAEAKAKPVAEKPKKVIKAKAPAKK